MDATASIHTAAQRTGLSTHAIRAWERRYRAIEPSRSIGKHRLFSEADIRRLRLLSDAVQLGHGIGKIAALSNAQLLELIERNSPETTVGMAHSEELEPVEALEGRAEREKRPRYRRSTPVDIGLRFRRACLEAITCLHSEALDAALIDAQITLGDQGLLRFVVSPLAEEIGEMWRQGTLTAAQEHFFTTAAKQFVWNLTRQYKLADSAPRMVMGTPAGQLHDMAALMAAASAANMGWRVAFVGPNLPAFELAGAVRLFHAQCLGLSITYPDDDPNLGKELQQLRQILPESVHIIIGGRAAPGYSAAIARIGARFCNSLDSLCFELDEMRKPRIQSAPLESNV
jgi:DNA-binding transcriptional MerR regulator/methanogenic corrinoid protein MtbC1